MFTVQMFKSSLFKCLLFKFRVHSSLFNVQLQCSNSCSNTKFNAQCLNSMFDVQSSCPVLSRQCTISRVQSSIFMFMFTDHSSKILCSVFIIYISMFIFTVQFRDDAPVSLYSACLVSIFRVLTSNETASEYNFTGTIVDCSSL